MQEVQTFKPRNGKYENPNTSLTAGGKLPPQAVDLEEAVLGAIMLEKDAISEIADFLRPETFYKPANQKIYSAIQDLMAQSEPVDIMTVMAKLKKNGQLEEIGGGFYITELTSRVTSSANIEYHARIIQQQYIKRELIRSSANTVAACYSDETDIFDLLSQSEFEKDQLLQTITVRKEVTNSELFMETLKEIEKQSENNGGITGIPSGFTDLDRITAGWQRSDLIILAARPGMGKTSLALQCAINASFQFGLAGAVFSLEMSKAQLMRKELAIECDIPLERFRKGTLSQEDWKNISDKTTEISEAPIHWDDTPGISLIELSAKARRLKRKYDIQYIIIDYLQLMVGKVNRNGNREQEIGQISRGLKGLAKELNIPVIALSQLSRKVEERPSKRPMLSDLRESGSIEQDADMVLFLYRPEYYGITEDEAGGSTDGMAELIIAKHRNGATDDLALQFNKRTTGFADIVEDYGFSSPVIQSPGFDTNNIVEFKSAPLQPNTDFEQWEKMQDPDDEVPF